jgi:hypothetical protein
MSFLNPTYLWGLLGLTIPIAIHLWSKKEGKTIKIGSIKLLSEADSKQSSSITLNEFWLLILRLLLITLLVFIIAEPQYKQKTNNDALTYIIEPSLLQNKEVLKIIDTLKSDNPIRLLKSGLPEIDTYQASLINEDTPRYWQLAKAMEMLPSDSIVVLTSANISRIKGKRPKINKNIEWLIINPEKSEKTPIEAVQKDNEIEVLFAQSDHQGLSFEKEYFSTNSSQIRLNPSKDSLKINSGETEQWFPITTNEVIKVLMFYDDAQTNEANYIEASFNAISKHIARTIEINKTQVTNNINFDDYHFIVWLSNQSVVVTPSKLLIYKPDNLAKNLISEGLDKNVYYLTKSLTTENIVEEHLPEQLLKILDLHKDLEGSISQLDKRVMSKQELQTSRVSLQTDRKEFAVISVSKWLWLLLFVLLIVERIIANLRKQ